jgi:hypothetical protein
VSINGGAIHNGSGRELRNIRVVHHETRKVITSNSLLPGCDFLLEFDAGEMKAKTATFVWEDPLFGTREVFLELPHGESTSGPQWLVYTISTSGQVTAKLVPGRQ